MNYDVFLDLNDVRDSKISEPKINIGIKIDQHIYNFSWGEFRKIINQSGQPSAGTDNIRGCKTCAHCPDDGRWCIPPVYACWTPANKANMPSPKEGQ